MVTVVSGKQWLVRPRETSLWVLPVCVNSFVVLAACGLYPSYGALVVVSFTSLITAIYVSGILLGRMQWLPLFFTTVYIAGFLVRGILVGAFPHLASPLCPNSADELCLTLLVGSVGWSAFVIGALTYRSPVQPRCSYTKGSSFRRVTSVGIGLGLLARAIHQAYANADTEVVLAGQVATLGLICIIARLVVDADRHGRHVWIALAVYAALGLLTGQRANCFTPVIAAVIARMLVIRVASIREFAKWLAIGGAVFCLLFPLLTRFKMIMTRDRATMVGKERLSLLSEELSGTRGGGLGVEGVYEGLDVLEEMNSLSRRLSQLEYGAVSVCWGPEVWGALKGKSLYDSILQFVPRWLWRSKPVIGLGQDVYALLYSTGLGAATVPVAVDLYVNCGYAGVVLGMIAMGIAYSVLGAWVVKQENPIWIGYLAVIAFDLAYAGLGIAGVVYSIVFYGVAAWGLVRLSSIFTEAEHRRATASW